MKDSHCQLSNYQTIETHPLGFFIPEQSRVLMLGSFPPKQDRWSMNFYYPNFQNDMWRILGLIFFKDKNYFIEMPYKKFDENKARNFCINNKIALGDTALKIVRLKNNSSDNFLKVIETADIKKVISKIPNCTTIILTGQKAMDIFLSIIPIDEPSISAFSQYRYKSRTIRVYRMPSTSRAYPKSLTEKANVYKKMFQDIGLKLFLTAPLAEIIPHHIKHH
ncbi:MAG: uracil-DNA glycosylase family protein [Elusimicrobiota bacterium]|jgi:G:T/U-mismatch repair DNA glycosylase|nr:uracil-DNA glycosylase family protein [Elusimicrobiota bacterium]